MIYLTTLMIIYMFFLRKYKNELSLCLDQIASFKITHSNIGIIGMPISDFLHSDRPPSNSLVFIASTTCSYCHSTLEELLEPIASNGIPLSVWVMSDTDYKYQEFMNLFSNLEIEFLRINEELLQYLNIQSIPYMLYLDENSVIAEMDYPSSFFVNKVYTQYV